MKIMILAKFGPNRTSGSKVMTKKFIFGPKKVFLEPFRNRTNYPVPGYPDFLNYPVLVTRFLTSLGMRGSAGSASSGSGCEHCTGGTEQMVTGHQSKPKQTMDDLVTGCGNVNLGTPTRHHSVGTEWSHGTGSCINEQRNWAATRQLAVAGIKANTRGVQFDGKDAAL